MLMMRWSCTTLRLNLGFTTLSTLVLLYLCKSLAPALLLSWLGWWLCSIGSCLPCSLLLIVLASTLVLRKTRVLATLSLGSPIDPPARNKPPISNIVTHVGSLMLDRS